MRASETRGTKTGNETMNANQISWNDRLVWGGMAYAAGDMIAYVAACWSCEIGPCSDELIPWEMESKFMAMSLSDLVEMVEQAMLDGRGWETTKPMRAAA